MFKLDTVSVEARDLTKSVQLTNNSDQLHGPKALREANNDKNFSHWTSDCQNLSRAHARRLFHG